jgi:hypothetical protein
MTGVPSSFAGDVRNRPGTIDTGAANVPGSALDFSRIPLKSNYPAAAEGTLAVQPPIGVTEASSLPARSGRREMGTRLVVMDRPPAYGNGHDRQAFYRVNHQG